MQELVSLIFLNTLQVRESPGKFNGPVPLPYFFVVIGQVKQALSDLFIENLFFIFTFQVGLKGVYGLELKFRSHDVVELTHLMNGDALSIFTVFSPGKTFSRLVIFVHFLVAGAHRVPHSRILRP